MEKTLMEEIADDYPKLTQTRIRNILAAFLFTEDDVFKRVSDLSGGERGRLSLAKLMLSEANFLILDEPTRGIDAGARTDVYNIIKGLSKKGLAVLLISSDMEEIIELSDRAVTIHQGRLNCEFDRADINQENLTKASFGVIGKEKES